jgi:hypothetical protein
MSVDKGIGGELSVSTTAAVELIVPNPSNGGGNNDFADELHIWNTGSTDVRVQINTEAADIVAATAMLIPAGKDHYTFSFRNPIKKFSYVTESGTSTIKYSAS